MGRILVVDDEETDRLIEQAILERAGHEVVFAKDGEEAQAMCANGHFQVVITDLQMPRAHGFELITVLRELPEPPLVIAVSGTGSVQLEMADALGAKFTLSKPIDPDALVTAVDQLMRFLEKSRAG